MANETINTGSLPNDGTGDSLRVAFDKINNNFANIAAAESANYINIGLEPQVIDIGGSPNDGTGDPVQTAFLKVNNNFANFIISTPPEIIDTGFYADDGTGDPLQVAFDKVNNNFTSLVSLDSGTSIELINTYAAPLGPRAQGNVVIEANAVYLGSSFATVQDETPIKILTFLAPTGPFGDQEYINIGDEPNDGTGDPLRVAFDKINTNFSSLFQTTTTTHTVYTTSTDPNQAIWEYPADGFTQCVIQLKTSDPSTADSQGVTFSAQLTNDGTDVKYTAYGITFNGNPLVRYNMDVSDGNVRLCITALEDRLLLHFMSIQVTFIGVIDAGIDIGLDGYTDSVMVTENGDYLTLEN